MAMFARISSEKSPCARFRRNHMKLCLLGPEYLRNRSGEAPPLLRFRRELFPSGFRQPIKTCPAIVIGYAPFGLDPAVRFQALQCGIKGTVINKQLVAGLRLYGS